MGLPTGSFSSPYPGVLRVELRALFWANNYSDAGFPNSGNGGGSNVAIKGYAGPAGSPSYTAIVDKYNLLSSFEVDYPGGNVAWPVGVLYVANKNPSGIYNYGMSNIKLSCWLEKK